MVVFCPFSDRKIDILGFLSQKRGKMGQKLAEIWHFLKSSPSDLFDFLKTSSSQKDIKIEQDSKILYYFEAFFKQGKSVKFYRKWVKIRFWYPTLSSYIISTTLIHEVGEPILEAKLRKLFTQNKWKKVEKNEIFLHFYCYFWWQKCCHFESLPGPTWNKEAWRKVSDFCCLFNILTWNSNR